jgi:hypothetical protein
MVPSTASAGRSACPGRRKAGRFSGVPARRPAMAILFRELLSIWTSDWLFWFGLLFVGFILFSPDGLVPRP